MRNEPVAVFAAIQAAIISVIGFGEAFNAWELSDAQTAAVTGLWVTLTAVYAAVVRSKVSPVVDTEAFGE